MTLMKKEINDIKRLIYCITSTHFINLPITIWDENFDGITTSENGFYLFTDGDDDHLESGVLHVDDLMKIRSILENILLQ